MHKVYINLPKNLAKLLYSVSILRIYWERYSHFRSFIYLRSSIFILLKVFLVLVVVLSTRDSLVTHLEAPLIITFILRVVEMDQS